MEVYGEAMSGHAQGVQITQEGYLQKLSAAAAGMGTGAVLFISCLMLAGWNEYRAVATDQTLLAASDHVVHIGCNDDPITLGKNGSLIHLSCDLSGLRLLNASLLDPGSRNTLGTRLSITIKVYQIMESSQRNCVKNSVGGGSTCTTRYTYWTEYSSQRPDTSMQSPSACRSQLGLSSCTNVDPTTTAKWIASPDFSNRGTVYTRGTTTVDRSAVKVGRYIMPNDMIDTVGTVQWSTTTFLRLPDGRPTDGDGNNVQVTFSLYSSPQASVMAQQADDALQPWPSPFDSSYTVYNAISGPPLKSAAEMVTVMRDENYTLTWILRFLTWLGTFVGMCLVTAPLTVVADIIPCIGPGLSGMIGIMLCGFNCCLTACCWLIIAGACWVYYRPNVGIPLLVIGCVCAAAVLVWQCIKASSGNKGNEQRGDQYAGDGKDAGNYPAAPAYGPGGGGGFPPAGGGGYPYPPTSGDLPPAHDQNFGAGYPTPPPFVPPSGGWAGAAETYPDGRPAPS